MATVEGKLVITVVDEQAVSQARELAIEGLQTDGGHHKQWYLEEIAKTLGVDLEAVFYDPGIPA